MKNVNKNVARRDASNAIMTLRLEKHMSQTELAEVLGMSVAAVSLYEQGLRFPGKEMCQKICDYFNCDMNYLYGMCTTKNSLRLTETCRDITVYDKKKILNNGSGLSKSNKMIFDVNYVLHVMSLPNEYFKKNKSYFAIKSSDNNLSDYGVGVDDICIFSEDNLDDIDNNKIVCCLVNGKVLIRKISFGKTYYTLATKADDDNPIKIMLNDPNEHIIGQLVMVMSSK